MRLILLPGMDGTGLLFEPLLEQLDDLPCSVITYPNNRHLTYEQATDYILGKLPERESFVLLAESYSGRISFNIALRKIPNLKGLIFVASFLSSPRPALLRLLRLLPLSLIFRLPIPASLLRLIALGPNATDSKIALFRKTIQQVDANVLAARLRDIADLKPPLKPISIPCHYIQARDDRLIKESSFQDFATLMPQIKKKVLPGPHLLLQTYPKECADFIRHTLRQSSPVKLLKK